VNRGDVFRTQHAPPERGSKPGYYVVVSRQFIVDNDDVATVVCAPIYGEVLGIATEVVIGSSEGVPKRSAVRCDFLMLMFKHKLSTHAGTLAGRKLGELDRALAIALDLGG
jgi:mRNA-degrading endonuclease toxin of MazEF toxin-antitoxin module